MKQIKSIVLFFIILIIVGCDNNIKKEYYESGELLAEYDVINNIKSGIAKEYYETGELFRVSRYKNDTLEGRYWEYSKSGKISAIGDFINGKLSSSLRKFHKEGGLKRTYLYYDDELYSSGEFESDGSIKDTTFFIDIIIPDTIYRGDKVKMELFWFNKDFFQEYKFSKGEITKDRTGIFNKKILIERTNTLKGDSYSIELPTEKSGYNYWVGGLLEAYFEKGGEKYAAFPVDVVYYVEE